MENIEETAVETHEEWALRKRREARLFESAMGVA